MKSLVLLALVGFVLAIGLALPFSEDKDEVDTAELKQIANDFPAEDSEDGENNIDGEDEDGNEDEQDEDENDEDENAIEEDGEDDDDDENEDEGDDSRTSLSDPVEKSSDPIRFRRVFRRVRRFRPRRVIRRAVRRVRRFRPRRVIRRVVRRFRRRGGRGRRGRRRFRG